MSGSGQGAPRGTDEAPTVVMCPGGPILVRGDAVVETEDGVRHRTTRPVSAICRCAATSRAPWCDGTHKLLPASRPTRPPG